MSKSASPAKKSTTKSTKSRPSSSQFAAVKIQSSKSSPTGQKTGLTPGSKIGLALSIAVVFALSVITAINFLRPPQPEPVPIVETLTIAKPPPPDGCDATQILENLAACSVAIRSNDYHYGSGFIVAPGHAITSYHVVSEVESLYLTQGVGELAATVSAFSEELDLALLEFSPADALPTCIFDLSTALTPLTTLYATGWPYDSSGRTSFTTGHFSRYTEVFDHTYLQIDINVMPGNSGGPIASACGVVGINSFQMQFEDVSQQTIYQGFANALPSPTFIKWLESLDIKI